MDFENIHQKLCKHAGLLTLDKSTLANFVSAHFIKNSLAFAQLERFLEQTAAIVPKGARYNIGSLGDHLVISVGLRRDEGLLGETQNRSKKKRKHDDSADRAKAAVDAARKRLVHDSSITETLLDAAQQQIERLFRDIKGAGDELVFESLGLSVTPTTLVTASCSAQIPSQSTRPKLIIACRLSAGIAVSIHALRSALGDGKGLPDGLLTTSAETLGPEFRLPLSVLGRAAEKSGQKSILLFSAVAVPNCVK